MVAPASVQSAVNTLADSETIGVAVAGVLILALRLALPAGQRRLLRLPIVLLLLHGLTRALLRVISDDHDDRRVVAAIGLILVLASIGRSLVLLLLEVFLGRRLARPLPKIIRDITQGLVYVVVLLTALRHIGVEPGSILTTSALLTAIVALSLQDTLGNMVAGLAIQVERPFDVDDWIQFDADPKHIGKVLEINWRATKVLTLDDVEITIPNSALAKAPISNFTKPTLASRRSLYVQVPSDVPPHDVHVAILEALVDAPGLVPSPAPTVVTNAFLEGNVEYWVRFHTDQFHRRDGVDGGARDRIWHALARIGAPIAKPNRWVHLRERSEADDTRRAEEREADRLALLEKVDFLRAVPAEDRRFLARRSAVRPYATGELVVQQGDETSEMFIIEAGEAVVLHEEEGRGDVEVARLGPGEFFGEVALMTGERRTATVRAAQPSTMMVINHDCLQAVLARTPAVATEMCRLVAERQAALADAAADRAAPAAVQERSDLLLDRLRRFFAL